MNASWDDTIVWFYVMLGVIGLLFIVEYLLVWYRARQTRKDREIPDYHSDHFDLRRGR